MVARSATAVSHGWDSAYPIPPRTAAVDNSVLAPHDSRTLICVTNQMLTTSRTLATAVRVGASSALGAALLVGCSSEAASTNCGLDQCTVTFNRGVEGNVNVIGVDARFIGANGDHVTIEVAGERLSLTVDQAAEVAGLSVSVASVTDTQVAVRIARPN